MIGQSGNILGKNCCIPVKWFYSGKSGCNRPKVDEFGQKWFYSGKSGCNREKWLYLGKEVVFG